jgi:hypothetical protein
MKTKNKFEQQIEQEQEHQALMLRAADLLKVYHQGRRNENDKRNNGKN